MKHTKHMKFGAENAREGEGAMARITALINQKGGVAKTTTAHALAVGLARQGRRVLAIDCDPQGNLFLFDAGRTIRWPGCTRRCGATRRLRT